MPFATVPIDHQTIMEVYREIIRWLNADETNKSQVSRLTGISRNTLNRLVKVDSDCEPMFSNFVRLVKAYEVMEFGYHDPNANPDDLAELPEYNSRWKNAANKNSE